MEPGEDIEEAPVEEAVPAEPEVGSAPWSKELAERFQDEETRNAVDAYMRESVQPYVTELETKSKPNRDAARLWEAFHSDPHATFAKVAEEVYEGEPDKAAAIIAAAKGGQAPPVPDDDEPDTLDDDPSDNRLTPEEREFINEGISAKEQKMYDNLISACEAALTSDDAEANPDGPVPFDKEVFETHLVMHDGDHEAAMGSYRGYVDKAKEAFGLQIPQPGTLPVTPATETAPPALGSTTPQGGGVTPPQQENYGGDINKAIDDMFSEQPPPAVPS